MVVPDSAMIAEIMLFGEGFGNTKVELRTNVVYVSVSFAVLSLKLHENLTLYPISSFLSIKYMKNAEKELFNVQLLMLSQLTRRLFNQDISV